MASRNLKTSSCFGIIVDAEGRPTGAMCGKPTRQHVFCRRCRPIFEPLFERYANPGFLAMTYRTFQETASREARDMLAAQAGTYCHAIWNKSRAVEMQPAAAFVGFVQQAAQNLNQETRASVQVIAQQLSAVHTADRFNVASYVQAPPEVLQIDYHGDVNLVEDEDVEMVEDDGSDGFHNIRAMEGRN